MNKSRRKRIDSIISRIEDIANEIEDIKDEEQEAFDNLPEPIQYSSRGESMEDAICNLEEIDFSDAIQSLESARDI